MENFARPPVLDVPHEVECIRYRAGLKQKHSNWNQIKKELCKTRA